jgi:tRNA(fMet)-specific endonuclease VapC
MDVKILIAISGKKILLDTNIVIASFAGDQSVLNKINSAKTIFLPIVVLGELYYGAELSSKKSGQLQKNRFDFQTGYYY